jgi:hypothetical protein
MTKDADVLYISQGFLYKLKKFFCLNKSLHLVSFIHLEVDKTILSQHANHLFKRMSVSTLVL